MNATKTERAVWKMTANNKADMMEIVKILSIIIASIVGSNAVNSSSAPNERIAILETKAHAIETALPEIMKTIREIDKKQDSLIVTLNSRTK